MKKISAMTVLATGVLFAGCQDLIVENPNQPSLEASLSTPGNVETTVGSSLKYLWGSYQNEDVRQGTASYPGVGISGLADELTAGTNTQNFSDAAGRPRVVYNNQEAGNWYNRSPGATYWTAMDGCADVIRALNRGDLKLGKIDAVTPQGSHTQRAKWFCKLVEGIGQVNLGILWDRTLRINDAIEAGAVDIYDTAFVTPAKSIEWGMKLLQEAIDSAKSAPLDTTPVTWVNGFGYTNNDVIKLASSYKARAMVYGIRTDVADPKDPATNPVATSWDRTNAAYWTRVISYIDSGITSTIGGPGFPGGIPFAYICPNFNAGQAGPCLEFKQGSGFIQQGNSNIVGTKMFSYLILNGNNYQESGTISTANGRIAQEFLGPGDTTTAYLWWRALSDADNLVTMKDTTYASPDLRLPRWAVGTTINSAVTTSSVVPGTAKYFGKGNGLFSSTGANVPWANTRYYIRRYVVTSGAANPWIIGGASTNIGVNNFYQSGIGSTMRPEEMDLLKAEALIRRNGAGDIAAAVALINKTRNGYAPCPTTGATIATLASAGCIGGLPALLPTMTQTSLIPGSASPNTPVPCVPRSFRDPTKCGTIMDALLWEKRLEMSGVESTINFVDWRRFGMLRKGSMISLPIHGRELGALKVPYYTFGGQLQGSVGNPTTPYVVRGAPGDGLSKAWLF